MLIVLFLSLHILLILLYAIAIERGLSRHSYVHLLFAALVPLAGELCLLASFCPERLFLYEPEPVEAPSKDAMAFTEPVSREVLLKAIETKPKNLVEILKSGTASDDSEIAHISAAAVMKLQREHEQRISACKETYLRLEDNMDSLKNYIAAVDAYHASGLLQGEAAEALLSLRETLSERLRRALPGEEAASRAPTQNYDLRKDPP